MELVGGGFGRFHVKGWSSLGFPVFGLVLRYARAAGGQNAQRVRVARTERSGQRSQSGREEGCGAACAEKGEGH